MTHNFLISKMVFGAMREKRERDRVKDVLTSTRMAKKMKVTEEDQEGKKREISIIYDINR